MDKKHTENTGNEKPGKFARFNSLFGYFLHNIFRFIFAIFKFLIKISAIVLITFPFALFAMCFIAPGSAFKTLEALASLLQMIIDLFRS